MSNLRVVKITYEQFEHINKSGSEYEPFHVKLAKCLKPFKAKPKSDEKSPIAEVGQAFKTAYEKKFKQPYPAWGAKENGMIKNWLKSVSLEHALKLCSIYPLWTDPFIVNQGHTLNLLVTQHIKLWTDYTRAHEKTQAIENHKESKQEIKDHVLLARTLERHSSKNQRLPSQNKRNGAPFQIEDDG